MKIVWILFSDHVIISNYSGLIWGMIYWYIWEAYLIFQMTTQTLQVPFNNLDELLSETDFRVAIKPGGSQELTFRTSPFPEVQRVWKERIEPNLDVYAAYR